MSDQRPENQDTDTNQNDYKYDVAFSFCSEDEALAREINDLVQDRMFTFAYWERQEDVAGTDGDETYNRVFGEESRIVVVLYRDGWGDTPWTRYEATAIKNRAYSKGYDFAIFIPVAGEGMPPWVPKPRLWVDLDRGGAKGAAAVIEARVREAGGSPRAESVTDYAARLSRQAAAEKSRNEFLASPEGVEAASAEVETLLALVDALAKECQSFFFRVERKDRDIQVCSRAPADGTMVVAWSQQFANSLRYSGLRVQMWNGNPASRGTAFLDEEPIMLTEERYDFDRDSTGQLGWRSRLADKAFLTSPQLAESCLRKLIDRVHAQHISTARRLR